MTAGPAPDPQERKSAWEQLCDLLRDANVEIKFGLYQQGKLDRVVEGVMAGESYESIATAIGWASEAVRRYLPLELIGVNRTLLADLAAVRAQLEEAAEIIRKAREAFKESQSDGERRWRERAEQAESALTELRAQLQDNTNEYIEVVHDQGVKLMQAETEIAALLAQIALTPPRNHE